MKRFSFSPTISMLPPAPSLLFFCPRIFLSKSPFQRREGDSPQRNAENAEKRIFLSRSLRSLAVNSLPFRLFRAFRGSRPPVPPPASVFSVLSVANIPPPVLPSRLRFSRKGAKTPTPLSITNPTIRVHLRYPRSISPLLFNSDRPRVLAIATQRIASQQHGVAAARGQA